MRTKSEYSRLLREKRKSLGLCIRCAQPVDDPEYFTCSICRRAGNREVSEKKIRRKFQNNDALDKVATEARKHGMSYGEYVARMEGGK